MAADDGISNPRPCPEAFSEEDQLSIYSQAALLLALGIILKAEYSVIRSDLEETRPFELPRVAPSSERVPGAYFRELFPNREALAEDPRLLTRFRLEAARSLYQESDGRQGMQHALRLLALSLEHSSELIRVSAAVSVLDLVADETLSIPVLEYAAIRGRSELIRSLALMALNRVRAVPLYWQASELIGSLFRLLNPQGPLMRHVGRVDSCIVHGTLFSWAGQAEEEWWAPGDGDFHEYLKRGPRPGVYSGNDFFDWSGGWRDKARHKAATELVTWLQQRALGGVDMFAHSHGGNVAMLASHQVKLGKLILMSCPVHWTQYQPNFTNVASVVSIRIKWDFVILADRGGQRFADARIQETVLPFWYVKHGTTHLSSTWANRKLDKLI